MQVVHMAVGPIRSLAVVNQHNSAEIINGAKLPDTTYRPN